MHTTVHKISTHTVIVDRNSFRGSVDEPRGTVKVSLCVCVCVLLEMGLMALSKLVVIRVMSTTLRQTGGLKGYFRKFTLPDAVL